MFINKIDAIKIENDFQTLAFYKKTKDELERLGKELSRLKIKKLNCYYNIQNNFGIPWLGM